MPDETSGTALGQARYRISAPATQSRLDWAKDVAKILLPDWMLVRSHLDSRLRSGSARVLASAVASSNLPRRAACPDGRRFHSAASRSAPTTCRDRAARRACRRNLETPDTS